MGNSITKSNFIHEDTLDYSHSNLKNCNFINSISKAQLSQIVKMYLNYNELTCIPKDTFTSFINLTMLDLSNNSLRTLPSIIASLVILDVSNNRMEEIPDCIYEMRLLKELHLKGNKINKIEGERLMNLKCLQLLDLTANKLISLPKQIAFMHNLIDLRISMNTDLLDKSILLLNCEEIKKHLKSESAQQDGKILCDSSLVKLSVYSEKCKICWDCEIDLICIPCGHLCFCSLCYEKGLVECPICRSIISKVQRVILS